jgi:protein MpaA
MGATGGCGCSPLFTDPSGFEFGVMAFEGRLIREGRAALRLAGRQGWGRVVPVLTCFMIRLSRSRDPEALMVGWRSVARRAGLELLTLSEAGGEPIFVLSGGGVGREVYLSAGVHGDEPAAVWGLLEWASTHDWRGRDLGFVIFPCLNPWGLRRNMRLDYRGRDLNRRFQVLRDPLVAAWRRMVRRRVPSVAICLHEDYDAEGCYVYERSAGVRVFSRAALQAADAFIPVDRRRLIEGRAARDGVVRRREDGSDVVGRPEALALWDFGCPLALTFETPSEREFGLRVGAHSAFVGEALKAL